MEWFRPVLSADTMVHRCTVFETAADGRVVCVHCRTQCGLHVTVNEKKSTKKRSANRLLTNLNADANKKAQRARQRRLGFRV